MRRPADTDQGHQEGRAQVLVFCKTQPQSVRLEGLGRHNGQEDLR